MPVAMSSPVVNRLIAKLARTDRERLLQASETVELPFGAALSEQGQAVQYVYFPLDGFVSLTTAAVDGRRRLEMGLIGNEGMLGATLALGVDAAPLRGVVQVPGTAVRVCVPQFRRVLKESIGLQQLLGLYLYVLLAQLSQTVACGRFHLIEARLSRWLLMAHDRAHADHFHLTHQWLADMLGVQRSAITLAAGKLRAAKTIAYARGEIVILDRKRLEETTCTCYGRDLDDYAQRLDSCRAVGGPGWARQRTDRSDKST